MERLGTTKSAYKFEKLLAVFGFFLLAIYGLARMYQMFASRAEVRRFWEAQEAPRVQASQPDKREPDFRLWSPQRIAAYKTGLRDGIPTPIAVLQITSVGLEVPVLEGTADATLDQGAGHIEGTPGPGTDGNIGIAAHRDGFFRSLKDIQLGDTIELIMHQRTDRYIVDETVIVSPDDISVLRTRRLPSLTLVTCYPFYFVGSAPKRFIVHASLIESVNHEKSNHQVSSVEKGGGPEPR